MPTLELSELEAKMLWLIVDRGLDLDTLAYHDWASQDAARSAFEKVYRAYRQMPPQEAA